jgi:hypothetical protein
MRTLAKFRRRPSLDRRLLLSAAALHLFVAIGVRVLPFAWVRRALDRLAAFRSAPGADDINARVVRAVRTVASLLPGANCLTDALVARCLLARHQCEATLCFGVSRIRPADRPFDAHAWIEHGGSSLIGQRATAYDPFRHPSRCASSPSAR